MSRKRRPREATPRSSPKPPRSDPTSREDARTKIDASTAVFAVDRCEGTTVVVVDDAGRTMEVNAARLPARTAVEGAVLRVPLDGAAAPRWEAAVRDRGEERRRRAMLGERITKLMRSDPGGDVVL
jgi:hypothetical protein